MPHLELTTGVTLFYERGGAASEGSSERRPTVVFVNGLTMDTGAWQGVASRLESYQHQNYPTLRYDCRGQGASDKPTGPYTPEQHAGDLGALLDALELCYVHLVGLSNGGLIAALLAGNPAWAERVSSLTMVDSFARVDPLLRRILRSWRAALDAGGSALRFEVATPWVWGHTFLAAHAEELEAVRLKTAHSDPNPIGALIDGLAGFGDASAALRRYGGPLLTLVGSDDLLTPARYSREILAFAGRGELLELEGAGHASPIEKPAAVAEAVWSFLREHGDGEQV